MTLSNETTIRRSIEPVETTIGSEVVLMTLSSGECYGLGETGSDVWRGLASPTTLEALVGALRAIYEAPEGVIEADVRALLDEMHARGLVQFT